MKHLLILILYGFLPLKLPVFKRARTESHQNIPHFTIISPSTSSVNLLGSIQEDSYSSTIQSSAGSLNLLRNPQIVFEEPDITISTPQNDLDRILQAPGTPRPAS